MKTKIKKKWFFLILIIIFFYIFISNLISNTEYNNYLKLKSLIPNSIKHQLKKTIFIIPTLKKELDFLVYENENLKLKLKKKNEIIDDLRKKIPGDVNESIKFERLKKNEKIITKFSEYKYSQFITYNLLNGKADDALASGYIEEINDKILIASADGTFLYFKKKELFEDEFKANIIKTNIKDIIKNPLFYVKSKFGIKDIFLDNGKLFVSFSNLISKDCYNTSILEAEFNLDYLKFEIFFNPKECIKKDNEFGSFNAHIAGGKITNFVNNQLLFSTGSFQHSTQAQNEKNVFGKILAINKETKEWKIVSMGHRNVQGLGYDAKNDVIYSSEHGPIGGDEFNLNLSPSSSNIKNYGWPISSYGEHYGGKSKKNKSKYIKAPLKKSHSKYGFIEPLKYFTPSIGISELIKMPKKFNQNFENDFFISALGKNREEGDLSIHHLKLDKNFKKILKDDVIFIGERIRDMKYIGDINRIILFTENSPGIGILTM